METWLLADFALVVCERCGLEQANNTHGVYPSDGWVAGCFLCTYPLAVSA